MGETAALARFAVGARLSSIPPTAIHAAKRLILDQFGCQVGSAGLPWSSQLRDVLLPMAGRGNATVLAFGDRWAPADAAFLNSAFGHANEVDDAHIAVRTHPGAVVIPAALAVGEELGVPGERLLLSVIVGYELMLRVARAGMPSLMEHRHHHTPPAAGPFGSAAAAGVLLGLGERAMHHALSIAGSHSSGLMEYTRSGGSVKRIHTAIPAQAGVRAAYFARAGMTGPDQVLEGERGFLAAFAGGGDAGLLVADLGDEFLIHGVGLKEYALNYRIHAPMRGLLSLMKEHSLSHTDLDSIRVGVSSATIRSVGSITNPGDAVGVQFSLPFALAAGAVHGTDAFLRSDSGLIGDKRVIDLARRIDLFVAPELEAVVWTSLGAVLCVRTRAGSELVVRVDSPKGSAEDPLTDEDVEAKFHALTDPVIGAGRAKAAAAATWRLEHLDTVNSLTGNLVRSGDS